MQDNKHIAIVRDGSTDFEILKTLVQEVVFSETGNFISDEKFIDLTGLTNVKLDGVIKHYIKEADKTNKRGIYDAPATKLRGEIILLLKKVNKEIEEQFYISSGSFSNYDVLILNDDTDKKLAKSKDFLQEWAYIITVIFCLSIQEFYEEKISQGYTYKNLPVIIPLIFFPSTEILIAAFRCNSDFESYRNQDAPQLKQKLYNTTSLRTLEENQLKELALNHIKSDLFESVFSKLPEIRSFFYQIIASVQKQ